MTASNTERMQRPASCATTPSQSTDTTTIRIAQYRARYVTMISKTPHGNQF